MKILFRRIGEFFLPSRATKKAAGFDLAAAEDFTLEPYKATLVPTNLEIAIPEGTALLVMPRSGNALKSGWLVPNSPGLIDEDYRGHLQVILTWIPHPSVALEGNNTYFVQKGVRVAQAVLVKYEEQEWVEVPELPPTERGARGFGSTGENYHA